MLEGCATKRKEKEEREETGPMIHRAALVDQLRGFAAAFAAEPRSPPSSTLLGSVRRHSAPFGVPRPAAEMRRAAARSPLPASRQLSRGMRGQKLN